MNTVAAGLLSTTANTTLAPLSRWKGALSTPMKTSSPCATAFSRATTSTAPFYFATKAKPTLRRRVAPRAFHLAPITRTDRACAPIAPARYPVTRSPDAQSASHPLPSDAGGLRQLRSCIFHERHALPDPFHDQFDVKKEFGVFDLARRTRRKRYASAP